MHEGQVGTNFFVFMHAHFRIMNCFKIQPEVHKDVQESSTRQRVKVSDKTWRQGAAMVEKLRSSLSKVRVSIGRE